MSQFGFSKEEKGYSVSEVDKYIQRLQEEYRNAVEWSNEIEKKAEAGTDVSFSEENSSLRKENEKLSSDCRLLASKLRELMDKNSQAQREASSRILDEAQEKASLIIRNAELKSASILEKAEKECQSIIEDAAVRIEEIKKEVHALHEEKCAVKADIDELTAMKNELRRRVEEALKLIDI